ncbi:hypothetical protein MA16_Dca008959 [Dendrobium catenatum]|uniref:Uncharacterized protein n=1 Tax=Dendrobium catenatum TaxID=906689 RepID=A0A2I0WRP2_9ASPA|nr:hypothetical protein MA16_Dca008959 [Dendrobium catenatum]
MGWLAARAWEGVAGGVRGSGGGKLAVCMGKGGGDRRLRLRAVGLGGLKVKVCSLRWRGGRRSAIWEEEGGRRLEGSQGGRKVK